MLVINNGGRGVAGFEVVAVFVIDCCGGCNFVVVAANNVVALLQSNRSGPCDRPGLFDAPGDAVGTLLQRHDQRDRVINVYRNSGSAVGAAGGSDIQAGYIPNDAGVSGLNGFSGHRGGGGGGEEQAKDQEQAECFGCCVGFHGDSSVTKLGKILPLQEGDTNEQKQQQGVHSVPRKVTSAAISIMD